MCVMRGAFRMTICAARTKTRKGKYRLRTEDHYCRAYKETDSNKFFHASSPLVVVKLSSL